MKAVDVPALSPAEVHADNVAKQRDHWTRYLSLAVLFMVFTINIVDRYLLVFLYSAPVEDDWTPEEKAKHSMKVR